jgi:hypothetical protein
MVVRVLCRCPAKPYTPPDQRRYDYVELTPAHGTPLLTYTMPALWATPTGGSLLLGHWKEGSSEVVTFLRNF